MKDGFKDIVAEIQNDYELLGTLLLEDRSGSVVRSIKTAECGSPPDITVGIFHQWLQGKGRQPVTWRALIECLRDTNLNIVAESIEDALSSEEGTCTTAQASTGSSMGQQQQPSFGMWWLHCYAVMKSAWGVHACTGLHVEVYYMYKIGVFIGW